jgi:hypothetical protein
VFTIAMPIAQVILFLQFETFNIQELLHLKSKRHETKPMHHPSSSSELSKETKNTI